MLNCKSYGRQLARLTLALGLVGSLAACGGGSGGAGGDVATPDGSSARADFSAMESWYDTQSRQNNRDLQAGNVSMPVNGVATYEGVARHYHRPDPTGGSAGSETMMSDFAVVAEFNSGEIEGYMRDFRREDGGPVDGMIAITGGTMTGNEMNADLNGRMTINGAERVIAGTLDARFAGQDAGGLQGMHQSSSNDGTLWGHVSAQRTDR